MNDGGLVKEFAQACIVLFAKAPYAGHVKTRMIPMLGSEGALLLHRQLLQRQIDVLHAGRLCDSELWVDQDTGHHDFSMFKGPVRLQEGRDLGEKMQHAASAVLQDYRFVILIGSDCPQLDAGYLRLALRTLQDCDLVLGPATDGGYVLIGMQCSVPPVFSGINWGSSSVMSATRARLREQGVKWKELPVLTDIDRPEDLKELTGLIPVIGYTAVQSERED